MDKEEFYANARRDLSGPLHGVTVVEATTTWAGPMAGCVLADLGARVIKVEHPDGEVARRLPPTLPASQLTAFNETVNRNKESLALDLRDPDHLQQLYGVIKQADIFIENFRPGTLAKWGLGYGHLSEVKADIVYVSISGYGQFGPLSDRVGYDPMAQNFSGWTSLNGAPDGGPNKAPTFLCDDLAGLHGALGAMAALRHRDQSGEGQHVDIALVDAAIFQSNGFATNAAIGAPQTRFGNEFSFTAPVNAYACLNGQVYAGVLLDSHWQSLAVEIGHPELAGLTNPERVAQREMVDNLLAEYCAARNVEDVEQRFAELGLPCTRINEFADLLDNSHVRARDMLIDTKTSDGTEVPLTGPAAKFSRTPTTIRHPAPPLGADNRKILGE